MKKIKHVVSWKIAVPAEVIIGIFVMVITFAFATKADMKNAQNELVTTAKYMKNQCNDSQIRDLASESKSLLRVTESVEQVCWHFKYDKKTEKSSKLKSGILKNCAKDSYLDGLLLLDSKGKVTESYDSSGLGCSKVMDMIDLEAVMDTLSFKEKSYAIRINLKDESHIDLAAVSRKDADGVVVGYFYTSAAYASIVNNSIRAVVSGFSPDTNGTIVISSGNQIVISNNKTLEGQNVENTLILKRIMERGTGTKLIHAKNESSTFGHYFGLMEKSRDYYIYAYMDEHKVFTSTISTMLCVLFAYVLVLIVVNAVMWKNEKIYQQNQMIVQKDYTAALEMKNKELEEAALRAKKANAAKSDFLSRMSHDIRTPLNGIIGLLKIDEQHFDDMELVRENHKKMQISARHLLSLINDVLQMSKLEDGKIVLTHEVIKLSELAEDIVTIIIGRAVESGIEWDYEKEKSVIPYPYVYGSPVHLRQIFLNIYGNCVKYSHAGGKITTVVDVLEEKDNMCTYRWTITDTGEGMSEEFLEHIFEPFTQEKDDARSVYQGTGLGMSIVKSLIEKMNGTISVTSKKGVGSTFVITIPFEIAPAPKNIKETHAVKKADINGMSLMLVEDNELNAQIAEVLLQDQGAKVRVARDGKQAVDMFEESHAGDFDAILMDVMMPVMDGITAAKTIRALDRADAKDIPIIAVTANAFKEDADKCLAAGMNSHVSKPLDIEKVKQILCEYVSKSSKNK